MNRELKTSVKTTNVDSTGRTDAAVRQMEAEDVISDSSEESKSKSNSTRADAKAPSATYWHDSNGGSRSSSSGRKDSTDNTDKLNFYPCRAGRFAGDQLFPGS